METIQTFDDLVSRVAHHHFCFSLLVRSRSLNPVLPFQRKEN